MKKIILFLALGALAISCSSDDDGFDDANVNVAKKYVTKVTTYGNNETNLGTVNYDSNGKVTTVSDGEQTRYFTYDQNGNLNKISGGGSNFLTSEVMNTIHDAY